MKKATLLLFILITGYANAQDSAFARKIVDTLTSASFWGRGYTKDGMHKAATFLSNQFAEYGLQPMKGKSYYQDFNFSINTFPNKMMLKINDVELVAGRDFIVNAESKSLKANGNFVKADSVTFIDKQNLMILTLKDKLTMDASQKVADYTAVEVDKKVLQNTPSLYSVEIDNSFIKKFKAQNICGVVKGTMQPDSIIFITAHYDHLGGLGREVYFPGANDNASGVSLLLNLARYYAKHPQPYTMGFILFAGEEAGLVGSKYFTENPLVDLSKIRFLINTDLAGTGVDGITVVNATEFKNEFKLMQDINAEMKLLAAVNPRGKAANSDHYWFSEKGVPSFFFYTLGGIKAYHDVFDVSATLPLNEHEDLFKFIVEFNKRLMNGFK